VHHEALRRGSSVLLFNLAGRVAQLKRQAKKDSVSSNFSRATEQNYDRYMCRMRRLQVYDHWYASDKKDAEQVARANVRAPPCHGLSLTLGKEIP
jgi:hypothetical protein